MMHDVKTCHVITYLTVTLRQNQPIVLVIGGPNGAGKTTCASGIMGHSLRMFHFVNADTLARGLSAYQPETVAVQAGKLMVKRLRDLGRQRSHFAFETTLAGKAHARFLRKLKAAGYWIDLLYISLPNPELCIERVAQRIPSGGHHIPETDIRRRFTRSMDNLFRIYLPLANRWRIYDNSQRLPRIIARGMNPGEPELIDKDYYDELVNRTP